MYLRKLLINRPLTPHLTVYSNQATSNYSIWHRITGIVLISILFFYVNFFKIFFFLIFSFDQTSKLNFLLTIKNLTIINVMIVFVYHILSGIKHIKWDLNYGIYLNKIFYFYTLMFLTLLYIIMNLILKIIL